MTNDKLLQQLSNDIQALAKACHNSDLQYKKEAWHMPDLIQNEQFQTTSSYLSPYIEELEYSLSKLQSLCNHKNSPDLIEATVERVVSQFSAIKNALDNRSYLVKSAKSSKKSSPYRKVAQSVMGRSHQLYADLTQHHEYERRLMDMIRERENKLSHADKTQGQKLQQEIFALHGRLGRCRRAICSLEVRIQDAERR